MQNFSVLSLEDVPTFYGFDLQEFCWVLMAEVKEKSPCISGWERKKITILKYTNSVHNNKSHLNEEKIFTIGLSYP